VAAMESNAQKYAQFMTDEKNLLSHCIDMKKATVFGGEPEIAAYADLNNVQVTVFQREGPTITFPDEINLDLPQIIPCYTRRSAHYDSVMKKETTITSPMQSFLKRSSEEMDDDDGNRDLNKSCINNSYTIDLQTSRFRSKNFSKKISSSPAQQTEHHRITLPKKRRLFQKSFNRIPLRQVQQSSTKVRHVHYQD
jgi:hypothetical protein